MSDKEETQINSSMDALEIEQSTNRSDNEKKQIHSEKIRYENADEIYE